MNEKEMEKAYELSKAIGEFEKLYRKVLRESGLTNDQFAKLLDGFTKQIKKESEGK